MLTLLCGCNGGGISNMPTEASETATPTQAALASAQPLDENTEENIVSFSDDDAELFYDEGVFDRRFWDSEEYGNDLFAGNGVCIPDKETAVAIASLIYCAQGYSKDDGKAIGVFFDTEEELWIVMFGYPAPSTIVHIVLRKDNAQVVAIGALMMD